MKIKILYILLILLSISCSGNRKELLDTKYKIDAGITMRIDSILIPLDSVLPMYNNSSPAYSAIDDCIYAYNQRTHSIDIFDLKNLSIVQHVNLSYTGPDAVVDVRNMQTISRDSIVLYSPHDVVIVNSSGKAVKKIHLNYDSEYGVFYMDFGHKMYYNNGIIYGILGQNGGNFDENSIVGSYDSNTNKWNKLSVKIPEYYKNNKENLGTRNELSVNFYNNRICYNATKDPNINVYLIDKNKTISSGGYSKIIDNKIPPLPINSPDEAEWEHYIENPLFFSLVYDPYNNCYYRVQASGTKMTGRGAIFNKECVIAVFDEKLNMIFEQKFPKNKFGFADYYVSPNGLLIPGNNSNDPSIDYKILKYYIVKFEGLK